jgi:hypothetical protein
MNNAALVQHSYPPRRCPDHLSVSGMHSKTRTAKVSAGGKLMRPEVNRTF